MVGVGKKPPHLAADRNQLRRRAHPVGRVFADAGLNLLGKTGNANHEELIQIRSEDGKELGALEQRVGIVERLFEHAALETEKAQLTVDVQLGVMQIARRTVVCCAGLRFACVLG